MTLSHTIRSADATDLHVAEAGNPDGPPLLLIHGWSQHHLSWSKQFKGALAERFRLIAPDLRGHGASDKPHGASNYNNSEPWADDLNAVITGLKLDKPLLVGWSMGGWVAMDYLSLYGDENISGLALVGSSVGTAANPEVAKARSAAIKAEGMYSHDHATALNTTIGFIRACVAAPLSKQDLAFMVGFNMLCPPAVRKAARYRDEDYRPALKALSKPAALFWGEAERVCTKQMLEETQAVLPDATTYTYKNTGHAPFWEAPEVFDRDLAEFADTAFAQAAQGVAA